ncbi:uncharacterized protein RHO17_002619 [Thomomys bottae]
MTWLQKDLAWSHKHGDGLQMPLGIPIAAGVLALLALLALACHCLKEACKSKWRPPCWRRRHPNPAEGLQLNSVHSVANGQLESPSGEPSVPNYPPPEDSERF